MCDHHVANDAQRDEYVTKINTVAASDTTVSFYSWIYKIFMDIYLWISYLASQYFLRGRLVY